MLNKHLPGALAFVCALAAASTAVTASAQEPAGELPIPIAEVQRDTPVDFEREILPLLKRSCLACHNATTAESDLVLENPQSAIAGGASGPAVVANKADESLLLLRASGQADSIMPPKDNKVAAPPLSSEELGLIKLWIQQGATGTVTGLAESMQWQPLPPGVNPIYAVAVTPDGQFAACGRANQIFIYHLPTGRFICRLTDPQMLQTGIYQKPGVAHLDLVQSLAFSPDGSTLASGGFQTIKLWSRPRDVRLATLPAGSATPVQSVAASPDGKWLATAGRDYGIQVWPLDFKPDVQPQPALLLQGHTADVTCLKFNADSTRLFSASQDKSIRAWQLPDGAPAGRIDAPAALQAIALAGDGSLLASGGGDNLVRLWHTPAAAARQIAGLPAPATAIAVSPDRKLLAAAGADGPIRILDLASLQVVQTLTGHSGAVHRLAFQPGGSRLASVGADRTLRIWDPAAAQQLSQVDFPLNAAISLAIDGSGNRAASGAADGSIQLWKLDAPPPRPLAGLNGAPADETAATAWAVTADGRLLATGGTLDGQPAIIVRDIAAGAVIKTITGHQGAVTALAFSPDAQRLASGSADHTARVWNLADGAQLSTFAGHPQPVTSIAFHPGGQQVLSASAEPIVRLWNAADGMETRQLAGHTGPVTAVAFTSDAQRIVTASADQTVRLWNPADGAALSAYAIGSPATTMALSRDNARIAVASADNQIRILQTADGALMATLTAHAAPANALSFSSDNARLASSTPQGPILVWDLARAVPLESLGTAAAANFALFGASPTELIAGNADKQVLVHALHFDRPLIGHTAAINALAFNADASLVYTASADGTVRGFQSADGAQRFASAGAPVNALAISGDGLWLAAACEDNTVRVLNAGDGNPAPKPQLAGFTAPVRTVAFTPDHQHVVAGGAQGQEILVFHLPTGEIVERLAEHDAAILALAIAGEQGELVVSASADNTVRLRSRAAVRAMAGHSAPITSLATLPSAPAQIVSGAQDNTLRVWNTADGAQLAQLDHGAPVTGVAARPDGQRIASVGGNWVRLWNAQNYQQVAEMRGDYKAQFRVAHTQRGLNARNSILAAETAAVTAAEQAAAAEVENMKKATEAQVAADKALTEKVEPARVAAEAKAAADKVLADATAAAKTADEAKVAADAALAQADSANKAAAEAAAAAKTAADADPNNTDLAAALQNADKAAADAAAALVAAQAAKTAADTAAANAAAQLKTATDDAAAKTKAADEAEAARASAEATKLAADKAIESANSAVKRTADAVPAAVAVRDAADAKVKQVQTQLEAVRAEAAAGEKPTRCVVFSPDNLLLAAAGDDGIVHTYSAETGAASETYTGQAGPVWSLAYAGSQQLAAGAADGTVALYLADPAWAWQRTIGGGDLLADRVTSLDFSPDGQWLASGGGDPSRSGELKLWNVADGSLVRNFADAHSDSVLGLDFSPEGNLLASCGADKFVKVWDVAGGSMVRSFEGHTHHVLGVSWRADAKILASCGADNVVKVWDFTTGDQRTTIAGFGKEVTSITFVGETSNVLTSSGDQVVRLHNVDNGQAVRTFSGGADFMYSSATTPDGTVHLAGGQDSILRQWNGTDGQVIRTFAPPPPEEPAPADQVEQQAMR